MRKLLFVLITVAISSAIWIAYTYWCTSTAYLAFDVDPISPAHTWYPPLAGSPSGEFIVFGKISFRKELFADSVPISACWLVVNQKKASSVGGDAISEYYFWDEKMILNGTAGPTMIQFEKPIQIYLKSARADSYTIETVSNGVKNAPLKGRMSFERRIVSGKD